jgi:phenylpropionate dioxygenase-like ring-hydroxylating dioxygenase large terminal subunit
MAQCARRDAPETLVGQTGAMAHGGEWLRVAGSDEVTTVPTLVAADAVMVVLVRLRPDGPVTAWSNRCPHRLVPLAAGVTLGATLRCPYHGWEFAADGRCVVLPSQPGSPIPPRAHLPTGPRVREESGVVWLDRTGLAALATEPLDELLSNVDDALLRAWHPVAVENELREEPLLVTLVGREWSLRDGQVTPRPYGLARRWGLLWLAPEEPLVDFFPDPDHEDEHYAGAWLRPVRTNAPAGIVADNFLDVAHFPFVHAATFGAGEEKAVPPYDVTDEPYGCRSVQVQWFDNPEDPGVRAGVRPVRQRRRATYVYRAPFQLMLRLEELDAGAVKTILFFAQPESLISTRIYTKMLLYGIGGQARPDPQTVAREVAFEEAVLAEDLALQRQMTLTGLPLRPRDELHVRADRLGVALRRVLRSFVAAADSQRS